jgi:pimeloyl-ACP methyl ester carboxylesterase
MPRLELYGTTFEYVTRGQGEPLILIHGTLEDYRSWDQQLEAFAESFCVLAYSRRYHFPNPALGSETDYAPSLHSHDLAGILDALEIGPAHLVGASYGAYIALTFATLHPERVRSLVLGEPPLIPWLLEDASQAPLAFAFYERAWKPAGEAFQQGDTAAAMTLFVDGVNRPGTFARLPEQTRQLLMNGATTLKIETQAADYFEDLSSARVSALTLPILLLGAQFSPPHFAPILDRLEALLPQAQRALIRGTGHAMNIGNAPAYNEIVLAFLKNAARAAR